MFKEVQFGSLNPGDEFEYSGNRHRKVHQPVLKDSPNAVSANHHLSWFSETTVVNPIVNGEKVRVSVQPYTLTTVPKEIIGKTIITSQRNTAEWIVVGIEGCGVRLKSNNGHYTHYETYENLSRLYTCKDMALGIDESKVEEQQVHQECLTYSEIASLKSLLGCGVGSSTLDALGLRPLYKRLSNNPAQMKNTIHWSHTAQGSKR